MSENCCDATLSIEESPRLSLQISGANYYGPYELPTMSADTKGGAKVGHGLQIENEVLGVKLVGSASGESFTVDGDYLHSMTVNGKSVQDGTPSPSAPVPVEVVQGINLLENTGTSKTEAGVTWTVNSDGSIHAKGTASGNSLFVVNTFDFTSGENYTLTGCPVDGAATTKWQIQIVQTLSSSAVYNDAGSGVTFSNLSGTYYIRCVVRSGNTVDFTWYPQLEKGSTATPYTPYGSIGLKVNDTIHPIDLQGNVLASLPDGTKDVLTVNGAGHCVIEKRVGVIEPTSCLSFANGHQGVLAGAGTAANVAYNSTIAPLYSNRFTASTANDTYSGLAGVAVSNTGYIACCVSDKTTKAELDTWLSNNKPIIYYKLATPQEIDLGYIDLPALGEGAQVSIVAQVTPTSDISWWEIGAGAVQESINAINARLDAIETSIAAIATS